MNNPKSYEGTGGWADGRLGQIYDLVDAVMMDHHIEHEAHQMLSKIMEAVEAADIEIGTYK